MTSPIPACAPGDEGSSRRRQIMEIAARLFARKGYRGASMRDIGEQAGVLGGSLYHHIRSKDALFVELHNAALDEAEARIDEAVRAQSDPWAKLNARSEEHTSELQSLMRISYAVFCLKKKINHNH